MRTSLLSILAALLWVAPAWVAPAWGHAILMESTPPTGGLVAAGPTAVTLRFNSRIDQGRSRLELRKAGEPGKALALEGAAADTLRADVPLAPGEWVLRWQVLAVDGHITRGDVPFTVKAP